VIPENKRRPNVLVELLGEAEGLLTWAIQGAIEYSRIGLADPESVILAVKEAVDEQDHVLRFIEEVIEVWTEYTELELRETGATSDEVFHAYEAWCASEGSRSKAKVQFGKSFRKHLPEFDSPRVRRDGKMARVYPVALPVDARNGWRP
jgi:putative DNA primase/helicase